jgi:hypothetical protein
MIRQLIFVLALAASTVVLHALGTVFVVMPGSGIWTHRREVSGKPRPVLGLTALVSLLLVLHIVEMAVWAAAYAWEGMLPDFETALYFSLKSYTTVGYGDVLLPESWRLVGPSEAAVGVLMLGWSTGIIVAAVQRVYNAFPGEPNPRP